MEGGIRMAKILKIIDCKEQCKKLEAECANVGKPSGACRVQRWKCEYECAYR
jgi:hypothetical protein